MLLSGGGFKIVDSPANQALGTLALLKPVRLMMAGTVSPASRSGLVYRVLLS
jgi:hypothetical protein